MRTSENTSLLGTSVNERKEAIELESSDVHREGLICDLLRGSHFRITTPLQPAPKIVELITEAVTSGAADRPPVGGDVCIQPTRRS
jgi:hypothetical protein